jgi:hypothetical protein
MLRAIAVLTLLGAAVTPAAATPAAATGHAAKPVPAPGVVGKPAVAAPPPVPGFVPKAPHLRAIAPDAAGFALWSPKGDWFLIQSRDYESLLKYSRDGRRLGRTPLAAAHKKVPFDLSVPTSPRALLSPDGKQLALPAGRAVWLLDVASGALTPLRRDIDVINLVWISEGKELLVSFTDLGGTPRHERIDARTGDVTPVVCRIPLKLGNILLDDSHVIAYSPTLLAVGLECGENVRPLIPFTDELKSLRPRLATVSPRRMTMALLFDPAVVGGAQNSAPTPALEGHVSLWVFSREEKDWAAVAKEGWVASTFAFLDDDTLIWEKRPGADSTEGATLYRFNFTTRKSEPLLLPPPGCGDELPSGSPAGGAVVFTRSCSDKKKSGVELVTP